MTADRTKFELLISYLVELVQRSYVSKEDIEFILNVFCREEANENTIKGREKENDK